MKTVAIIFTILIALFQNVYAGTVSSPIASNATLASSCTISATGFAFGNLTNGVQNTTTGSFNTLCTKGTAYVIKFGWGSNVGSAAQCNQPNPCPRMSLSDLSDYIPYYILLPGDYYAAGDGVYGRTYSATGTGITQTLTLNAKTMSNYYAKPGSYFDNVSVSVNF